MAKQVGVADAPATSPGRQVIEEKKTTTIDLAADQIPRHGGRGSRRKNPHINVWFSALAPDERANEYSYTIYRDDPRIVIVEENLDDRASGAMLDKLTVDQIRQWPEGPFLQELSDWTKERYGGGRYHVMAVMRKGSTLMYNTGFEVAGDPILSSREQYREGMGPLPGARSDSATFLPLIMKVIDEKLSAVTTGRQDPAAALGDVMKAGMEANTAAFKWAMDNMPKSADPATQLQTMQFMFNMMEKVFERNQPQAVPDALDQFTKFATILTTVRNMDRDSHPPAPAPAAVPVTIAATEGPGVKEIVRDAVAAAIGGRKQGTDWGGIAASVIGSPGGGNLLAGLGSLAMAGAGWLRSRMAPAAPGGQAPQAPITIGRGGRARPVVTQPAAGPQPSPNGRLMRGTPQPAQVETQGAAETAPGTEQIQVTEEVVQAVLFEYALKQIVDRFQHDDPGDVVADALQTMYPQLAVQLRYMSDDTIKQFIATNATLAQIKGDPRLPKFLEEFRGFFSRMEKPGEA